MSFGGRQRQKVDFPAPGDSQQPNPCGLLPPPLPPRPDASGVGGGDADVVVDDDVAAAVAVVVDCDVA